MKKEPFLRRSGMALLLTAGLFVLFYTAAMHLADSDFTLHSKWAMLMTPREMAASFYDGSERLWHLLVRFVFRFLVHDLRKASALVTAAADAAAYYLVFKTFDQAVDRRMPRWLLAVIMLVPFVVTPLTIPGGSLYVGVGGVSTWHNPTNIMVRPFAAAVFYMTVRIYDRRRFGEHVLFPSERRPFVFQGGFWAQFREPVYTRSELILYPLCLLLSVYAKPSFLQFFAPAIFLFLLIDVIRTKGMLLPFCLKLALAYIPALVIILMAFRGFFPSGAAGAAVLSAAAETTADAGIAVYFGDGSPAGGGPVGMTIFQSIRSLLLPCAFVLFVFMTGVNQKKFRPVTILSLLCLGIAFFESWFLHETGSRAAHGNFLWGSYLASWLTWTAAAGEFSEITAADKTRGTKAVLCVGAFLLLWHLICGIVYLVLIYRAGDYYI